jgi:hypothetical protein
MKTYIDQYDHNRALLAHAPVQLAAGKASIQFQDNRPKSVIQKNRQKLWQTNRLVIIPQLFNWQEGIGPQEMLAAKVAKVKKREPFYLTRLCLALLKTRFQQGPRKFKPLEVIRLPV